MAAIVLTILAVVLGTVLVRRYVGWPSTITLLQYQGGILYRRGRRVRAVAAGRHWVRVGIEKIIFLDKRPISVGFENRAVALSDGGTAVYGFSGSAEVRDVSKVLYCARNYNEVPAYVLLCCSRIVLNGYPSGRLLSSQELLVQEIMGHARPRLAAAGLDLQTFRFTDLAIASRSPIGGE